MLTGERKEQRKTALEGMFHYSPLFEFRLEQYKYKTGEEQYKYKTGELSSVTTYDKNN